jgi:hypothetical protein
MESLMNYKNIFTIIFSFMIILSTSIKAENNYFKVNYGISKNEISITSTSGTKGTLKTDDEDNGLMLSAGTMIGDWWGLDISYFDMGSSSIEVSQGAHITSNKENYVAESTGTISNDISSFGLGLIIGSNNDLSNAFNLDYYLKTGIHSWEKSGSTNILDNNAGFKNSFYNKGNGAYGGIGISMSVYNEIAIDLAYDMIGLSNDVSFSDNSSLVSAGLRFKF